MSFTQNTRIAVVGASTDPQKYGNRIMSDLLAAGYSVEGINPKGGQIADKQLYSTLADLPQVPELVIIVVPPTAGITVLKECAQLGITEVWMQPGAESEESEALAKKLGINLTTNTCFMKQQTIW